MPQRATATTRKVVAVVTGVALSFGLGDLALASIADAAVPYVATDAVNVRSGPGTSYKVIGVLALGKTISGSSTGNGWVKVAFQGTTGYVWGDYLKESAPVPATTNDKAATKITTADVNVRKAPDLDSTIVKVLAKGSTVATTGTMSERWAQVRINGALYWMSSRYLADPDSHATLPTVAYTAKTTAELAMRSSPQIGASSLGSLKAGSTVGLTGTHSGSYSQIVRGDAVAWLLTGYLDTSRSGPTAPALPTAVGKRYVTVDEVNIRSTSAGNSRVVDTVQYGTVLLITGKTTSSRTEVIFGGSARWAYTAYLSKSKPNGASDPAPTPGGDDLGSSSLNKTNAYAHVVVKKIRAGFPAIKTIYGWRMSSAYSSDHPAGRALDIMIPSYKSSSAKALGDRIARYLQDNYKALHVHYLIWRQRQWNVERNTNVTTGWRKMSDRGSDTDNHMNHVHVTVYDVK